MLATMRNERRAKKIAYEIEARATRYQHSTDEAEYLRSDLDACARLAGELQILLGRLLDE